jgi:hypothetical protein
MANHITGYKKWNLMADWGSGDSGEFLGTIANRTKKYLSRPIPQQAKY